MVATVGRACCGLRSLAVLLALYLGIHYGSFAAAGSDSYGYLSQARLWLCGVRGWSSRSCRIFLAQSRMGIFAARVRPFSPDGTIVPMPSGLPMLMAVFSVFGDSGPFYVVPRAGRADVVVDLRAREGRNRQQNGWSPRHGAASRLRCFLTHLLVPMSDIRPLRGGPWLR